MLVYLSRRLATAVVAVLVSSVLLFVLLRLLPGDIAQVLGGTQATPERIAALRAELGLDRSAPSQYLDWMGGIARGDFGRSLLNGRPTLDELGNKMVVTGPLLLASSVTALVVAVPLAALAAERNRRRSGTVLNVLSQLGIAVPTFFVGIALIIIFAVRLGVLPSQGFPASGWESPQAAARALVLPTATLALSQGAVLFRFARTAFLETLGQPWVVAARARGLTRRQALWLHGARNASLPVLSILGVQVASLLGGVVLIERVFTLPGVGQMLLKDVGSRDLTKVQGTVLALTIGVILVGTAVDVVVRLLDPRLRGVR